MAATVSYVILAKVSPPIKGVSRVKKINNIKFLTKATPGGQFMHQTDLLDV